MCVGCLVRNREICLVSENAGGKAVAVLICGLFSARLINGTDVQCPSDTIWFFHQSNRLIYPPASWLARKDARSAGRCPRLNWIVRARWPMMRTRTDPQAGGRAEAVFRNDGDPNAMKA